VIHAIGVRIRLDLAELGEADAAAVLEAWADAAVGPDAVPQLVLRVVAQGERAWWLSQLSRQVTSAAIEHQKGVGWMLHATGLADARGRVVAFVGESGAGKTTVAAQLGQRFAYVSDETVFIGAGGEVSPYRKPLSVRGNGVAPKAETPPSALGLVSLPHAPLRLATIAVLDRRADVVEPTAQALSIDEAVGALTAHTSFLSHLSRPLRFLAAVLAETRVVRLSYRDAGDLDDVDALWEAPVGSQHAAVETMPDADDHRASSGLRRAAVVDQIALRDTGRLLVLKDDVVHTLDGIAPTLWRALGAAGGAHDSAENPSDQSALVAVVMAAHGVPPDGDPAQLVADALDDLRSAGLVVAVRSGWRIASDCAWHESIGGRVVALPLRSATITTRPLLLDDVGSLIWRAIDATPGAAVAQVSRVVELELIDPPDDLADHVEDFIASLERLHLVDRV
jgi:hypothetical protein